MNDKARTEKKLLGFTLLVTALGFLIVVLSFVERGGLGSLAGRVKGPALGEFSTLPLAVLSATVLAAAAWGSHLVVRRALPTADPYLLPLAVFLSGLGLVLLFRLAPDVARAQDDPRLRLLALKQLAWTVLGCATFCGVAVLVRGRHLAAAAEHKYLLVVFSALLIAATAFFGVERNGRRLWIGLGPLSLQTVEVVKVLLVLFAAGFFHQEGRYIEHRRVAGLRLPGISHAGPFLAMAGLALLPIFFQGDLGPTLLIYFSFLALIYVGTGSRAAVCLALSLFLGAATVAYVAGYPAVVQARIDMWLFPFSHGETIVASLWSISAGGLLGLGIGRGLPAGIPVVQSDFNFAAICEEMGFVGAMTVLAVYALLLLRGFRAARRCRDGFLGILAIGLASLFTIQTLMIVGGVTGMLPMTGITLPFISYGGTSIVVSWAILGVLSLVSSEEAEA